MYFYSQLDFSHQNKEVMMYCFFLYIITSLYFLILFLYATYNITGTFPSNIALISSRSLPVMDAMFSGDIPLWFILRMIFASPTTSPMTLPLAYPRTSPSDSPSFLASSRSSFINSLNASHIFASLFISRYNSSFALTLTCNTASTFCRSRGVFISSTFLRNSSISSFSHGLTNSRIFFFYFMSILLQCQKHFLWSGCSENRYCQFIDWISLSLFNYLAIT